MLLKSINTANAEKAAKDREEIAQIILSAVRPIVILLSIAVFLLILSLLGVRPIFVFARTEEYLFTT